MNRLKERGLPGDTATRQLSMYAASMVLNGLLEHFTNAAAIMDWLRAAAAAISEEGQPVIWTTPLGLACGQPYRLQSHTLVRSAIQDVRLTRSQAARLRGRDAPVAGYKQARAVGAREPASGGRSGCRFEKLLTTTLACMQVLAFPPNYIHSLDSSHMMMTALACQEAGLAFGAVHDSFWSHAGEQEARPLPALSLRAARRYSTSCETV